MIAAMTLGAGASLVVVGWRLTTALRSIERQLAALHVQLTDLRRAHDHQANELHRRLNGIEAAARRAEREARTVSHQLIEVDAHPFGLRDDLATASPPQAERQMPG